MSEHEHSDLSPGLIVKAAIAFLVATVAIHIGVWWLFQFYRTQDERRDVRRTLVEEPAPVPPVPRLQVNPHEDLETYLQAQRQTLNSYGWVSRDEGRVRIPISRAMELVAEQEKKGER
jgi:hypothetical protein